MESLLEYWECVTCFTTEDIRRKWWNIICEKYNDTNRNYHNHSYLVTLFDLFNKHKEKLSNTDAISLAIFFHKLEHYPKSGDGDQKSIGQFNKFMNEVGEDLADTSLSEAVMSLLVAGSTNLTEVHMNQGSFGTDDIHFFLDFIVAVLGSSEKDYAQYVTKMKAEYAHLSPEAYRQLRLKTLKNLLLIPNVYATKEFQNEREHTARQNIQNEICQLENC